MAIKRFRQIQTTDKTLQLIQSALVETIDGILANPLVNAQIIQGVALKVGSNPVAHGLGRNYISWGWLNPSSATSLSYGTSPDTSKYITIVASAPATVDLVVF